MVDYTYYKETFGGALEERAFQKCLPKAAAYLRGATHGRALPEGEPCVLFCLCELIDLFSQENESQIAAESCDGFSVTYEKGAKDNAMWKTVLTYLTPLGVLYGGAAI